MVVVVFGPININEGPVTGRPGHRTMEMNGRSAVSYLVRTPCIPFFMLTLIGLEAKNRLAFQE